MVARTVLEFDPEADKAIENFVRAYQARLKELGREDFYEVNVASMKQNFATRKAKEAEKEAAEAESKSQDDSAESNA